MGSGARRTARFPGYMTQDPWPGHAGKFLQVQDYVLQSGLGGSDSCTGSDIMPIGTVAHETGHGFGLPDLYDTSDSTEGVGRWSLMGAGNSSSPSSPARMDAWSLSQRGWVTLAPLMMSGAYQFGAAPTSDTAFLVHPTGANPRGEYFLLENRQVVDADSALIRNACQVWYQAPMPQGCSGGLLAWHVDSQQIAQHGFESGNAVNAGSIHGLELLQADARGNLDANPNIPCTPPAAGWADRGDVGGATTETGTFMFRVSVTDGTQTARRTLTLQVVEPTLTMQQVLDLGFLGPAPASDDRRRYLDFQGNANGAFDIGDVARWLARTGNGAAPGAAARPSGRRP